MKLLIIFILAMYAFAWGVKVQPERIINGERQTWIKIENDCADSYLLTELLIDSNIVYSDLASYLKTMSAPEFESWRLNSSLMKTAHRHKDGMIEIRHYEFRSTRLGTFSGYLTNETFDTYTVNLTTQAKGKTKTWLSGETIFVRKNSCSKRQTK